MHQTKWLPEDVQNGYWGPITASIDWCEKNYDTMRHVAEPANTFTNLGFIALSVYGLAQVHKQRLPLDVQWAWIGMMAVGVGSFAFHATLTHTAQLADELPMIYASTALLYSSLAAGGQPLGVVPALLTAYDVVVTVIYLYWPNPVFHQVAYALTVLWTIIRITKLLRSRLLDTPEEDRKNTETRRTAISGIVLYGAGFFIWNVDNLACVFLTRQKDRLGYPLSFLLEGHAYWHLLTGLGSHYIAVTVAMLSACLSPEGHEPFRLSSTFGTLIPYVKRIPMRKSQ